MLLHDGCEAASSILFRVSSAEEHLCSSELFVKEEKKQLWLKWFKINQRLLMCLEYVFIP